MNKFFTALSILILYTSFAIAQTLVYQKVALVEVLAEEIEAEMGYKMMKHESTEPVHGWISYYRGTTTIHFYKTITSTEILTLNQIVENH